MSDQRDLGDGLRSRLTRHWPQDPRADDRRHLHRFSPAVDPRFSYRGEDVVTTLERVCKYVGYPKTIRVDQVSEFISRDLDIWAYQKDVVLDFSRPGTRPTTASSNRSTASSEAGVCEHALVPEP